MWGVQVRRAAAVLPTGKVGIYLFTTDPVGSKAAHPTGFAKDRGNVSSGQKVRPV
jgi:hypothetical protein